MTKHKRPNKVHRIWCSGRKRFGIPSVFIFPIVPSPMNQKGILMLKAIIFDYNGILVDDLVYHRDAYIRVAEELGFSLSPDAIWQYISATPDEKRVLFGEITDETWRKIRSLKDKYYFEMIEQKNLIIPGVEAVIKKLHSIYVLGLISNTSRRYYERIFPRHIADCFKETLFSEEMNAPKPSPDPLLQMMKMLAVAPNECCYVGDAISDAQMTRSAAVRMIGVTTGHHSREALIYAGADWVVNNLKEFLELIPKFLNQENRKPPIDGQGNTGYKI